MPDTITNLFGCCCDTPLDRFAITELSGVMHGFPPFLATFDPASYIASGQPPLGSVEDWNTITNLNHNWEPLIKLLCVGTYSAHTPSGWTIKAGVSSFAVGDLVHRTRSISFPNRELHSFYRCKVATSIGGDPAGLPDYFEPYLGNRSLPLDLSGPVLAYSSPLTHYTPATVYNTWTEVSVVNDFADSPHTTKTRQCTIDVYSGELTKVTDQTGLQSVTLDFPATANPVYYYGNFNPGTWDATYHFLDVTFTQGKVHNPAFPEIPYFEYVFTDPASYWSQNTLNAFAVNQRVYPTLTDMTVSATEIAFEFTFDVRWEDGTNESIIVTQTITLSDAYTFQDLFDYIYTNLPAIADYNFRDSYQLDAAGAVEQTAHVPWPYVPYGASNYALYQNNKVFKAFGFQFGLYQIDTRWALSSPVMRRLKYIMETDPHWVKTQVAGDAEASTEYNTSPLTHTFDPAADQEPEVVRVVLTSGG